jgi:tripartite-type tricarboxylate transporter receptor subunit TctC
MGPDHQGDEPDAGVGPQQRFYAAGGSADILARLIAAGLQTTLGQSVLVENRSGASGNVGTVAVARAAQVPTMIEASYPGFIMETTHVLVAPAGTPALIVERLAQETIAVLHRPDVTEKIRQAGFAPIASGPDQLKARFAKEVPAFRDLIIKTGIPPI